MGPQKSSGPNYHTQGTHHQLKVLRTKACADVFQTPSLPHHNELHYATSKPRVGCWRPSCATSAPDKAPAQHDVCVLHGQHFSPRTPSAQHDVCVSSMGNGCPRQGPRSSRCWCPAWATPPSISPCQPLEIVDEEHPPPKTTVLVVKIAVFWTWGSKNSAHSLSTSYFRVFFAPLPKAKLVAWTSKTNPPRSMLGQSVPQTDVGEVRNLEAFPTDRKNRPRRSQKIGGFWVVAPKQTSAKSENRRLFQPLEKTDPSRLLLFGRVCKTDSS